ncbi:hypothetical protein D3C83_20340 [compost metagenome]
MASFAAGRKVSGPRVMPHGRVTPSSSNQSGGPLNFTSYTGAPLGSIARIPFTSFGRASAMVQPNGPPWECVNRIAGPMRSSSAAPASRIMPSSWATSSMLATCDA